MSGTIVTASTSVVLVPTSSNYTRPYIVTFPNISTVGRLITVRDNDGYASTGNTIVLSTTAESAFNGIAGPLTINQPYGFITLTSQVNGGYSVLNTFAFPAGQAAANVSNLNAQVVNIQSTLNMYDFGTGSTNTIYTSSSQFIFNGNYIGQVTSNELASTVQNLGTTGYLSSIPEVFVVPPLWVAVGQSSTITEATSSGSIQVTNNGYNWSNTVAGKGFIKYGTAVAYGAGYYVAVGNNDNGTSNLGYNQWSFDGYDWYYSYGPYLDSTQVRTACLYANGLYHSVGCNAGVGGASTILWSENGKLWYPSLGNPFAATNGTGYATGITFGLGVWVCSGVQNTQVPAYNLLWSSDGSNWNPAANVVFGTGGVMDVSYDGTRFIALCLGGFNLASPNVCISTDGSNWTSSNISGGNFGGLPRYITGSNGTWVATTGNLGQNVVYSLNNGLNWQSNTNLSSFNVPMYKPYYDGLTWRIGVETSDGSESIFWSSETNPPLIENWTASNISGFRNGGYARAFTSTDGMSNVTPIINSTIFGLSVNFGTSNLNASTISAGTTFVDTSYVGELIVSSIGINKSTLQYALDMKGTAQIITQKSDIKTWVAVGEGTNSIATSSDGTTWAGLGTSIFTVDGRSVAWNGSLWVAVGEGTNSIATSSDGTTWEGLGTSIFTDGGRGVAWNGSLWVAVGEGTNSIATSPDGTTWAGLGTSIFTTTANAVAWNGSLWVAVGRGTNSIAISSDGSNWTGLGTSIFTFAGYGVAWNGSLWVAVGRGTNSIAISSDGSNWTGLGTSIFTVDGRSVAWNGSLWVAVGQGTNSIATSTDGVTWKGLGTSIFTTGFGVAWNGSLWVTVGQGANSIATSSNGTTWAGLGTSIFTSRGFGVAYSTSPLIPDVTMSNLNIYSQATVPNFLSDKNQIASYISTLAINNTLYVTNRSTNFVGINTPEPRYTLDVNGNMGIVQTLYSSTISTGTAYIGTSYVGELNASTLYIGVTFVSTTYETVNNISTQNVDFISAGILRAYDTYITSLSTSFISAGHFYASETNMSSLNANFISSGQITGGPVRFESLSTNTISSAFMYASSIGVNTPSPQYTLDVNGDINVTGNIFGSPSVFVPGMMMIWSASVAPSGWLICNGDSVLIASYPALYAIIGTTYGGSGSSFNLPDLRERFPLGVGSASLGSSGGSMTQTLTSNQMPSHSHSMRPYGVTAYNLDSGTAIKDQYPIMLGGANYYDNTQNAGGGEAFSTINSYLAINYIIKY